MGLNRTERAMSGSKLIACAFVAASLCGCFSSSSYTPELVFVSGFGFNAVPTGTSRVTVSGYFFTTSTTIYWNGRKQVTTYQGVESASAMQLLQVDLDTEATKVAGTAQVTATNEGSFLSAPLSVRIFDAVLALTAISPQQASLGAPATTLTVSGTGFRPASQVTWNGVVLQTTFVSSTSMTAIVPAPLLTIAGDGWVQISEPGCTQPCTPLSSVIVFNVGSSTRRIIQHETADLSWDATHSLLFASSFPQSVASSVAALDPVSATFGVSVATTGAPRLSVSDQDQFLYVSAQGGPPVRYNLPGLTFAATFPVGTAGAMAIAAPGAPTTAAYFFTNGNLG